MSPSPFVVEWLRAAQGPPRGGLRDALDIAMGRGRHMLPLVRAGFRVFGVDARLEPLLEASREARRHDAPLLVWCADLTQHPLPHSRFDLVLVARYLQRDLFPAIRDALVPGGIAMYETFTTAQRELGSGPRSPEHLLEPGELRAAFEGFEILFYEETSSAPEAVARLVARRRS